MSSSVLTCIRSALNELELLKNKPPSDVIRRLRTLRTFLLCTKNFGDDLRLKPDDNISKDGSLGSLKVRIEDAVCRNAKKISPYCHRSKDGSPSDGMRKIVTDFQDEIEDFEDEIDEWYTALSGYSRQSSSSADVVFEITGSVLENIMDYRSSRRHYTELESEQPIEDLVKEITFLKNFVGFVTMQSIEHRQLEDLLIHIETVAMIAADLFAHLLCTRDRCKGGCDSSDEEPCGEWWDEWSKKRIWELLHKIEPFGFQFYDAYTRALTSSKLSRQLHAPIGNTQNDPLSIMKDFINSLLELDTCLVLSNEDQLQVLYQGLKFLRRNLKEHSNKFGEKIRHLTEEVICDAAIVIFSLPHKHVKVNHEIPDLLEKIKVIQAEVEGNRTNEKFARKFDYISLQNSAMEPHEIVGYDDETTMLIDRLTRGSKQLQIVAIVGMAGIGKTTLGTKIYNHRSVVHHFHVLAMCSVSQIFDRKRVLLDLLNHVCGMLPDEYLTRNEDDLAEVLWRRLRRRRYLIFLDDVWDIQAWNSLKASFPDDCKESRILLTSRNRMLDEEPLFLRQLTKHESWKLLEKKLVQKGGFPPALKELGMQIAENCKGVPLTIVVVAGILATLEQEDWKEILESLSSNLVSSVVQLKNTLELSYRHLPCHLKPCFLYFGSFPEDQAVPAKILVWLWIAEGFVQKSKLKSLEDVATDCLKDLIGRSLVMVAERRSIGGVKACRVHDLIHDFCIMKAKEIKFSQVLLGYDEISAFDSMRVSIQTGIDFFSRWRIVSPGVRSLLFFSQKGWYEKTVYDDLIRFFESAHHLQVLHSWDVNLGHEFSWDVGHLVHLKYLAIKGVIYVFPSSIDSLKNLETLMVNARNKTVFLPDTFWRLWKLRHLHVRTTEEGFALPDHYDPVLGLQNLESVSGAFIYWYNMEKQLRVFPNIRKLKCKIARFEGRDKNMSKIMVPHSLTRLECLHLSTPKFREWNHIEFDLPKNLIKLALSGFRLPWSKISPIGKLPNLEVLKLLDGSFLGERWDMEEGEFSKLRYLKLSSLDIVGWTASEDQDLCLENLVLESCDKLKGIPSCLDSITTLEMIEVSNCSDCISDLVRQIQEMNMNGLKIIIKSSKN